MNRLDILNKKKDLLEQVLDIAKQLKPLLSSDDIDAINTRMNHREKIIKRIDNLDKELAASSEQPGDSAAVVDLEGAIKEILRQIIQFDKESITISKNKVKEYSKQLKSVKHVKKGIGGYKKSLTIQESIYIDKKK